VGFIVIEAERPGRAQVPRKIAAASGFAVTN
jgi:hypothetical protein